MTATTVPAGHDRVELRHAGDGWWSATCSCGLALGARRGHPAAADLHAAHLERLTRTPADQLPFGGHP